MIGTILFVVAFVVIGLAVVLLAMRSGRGRNPGKNETRASRRAQAFGIGFVIVAVGLGVPLLVLVSNSANHAKQGPGGVALTSAEAHGRSLFAKNCATCHTLRGSNAVGRVGPNLDTLNGGNVNDQLVLDAINRGRSAGRGQMPAGLLQGADARAVAKYVSAVAGR